MIKKPLKKKFILAVFITLAGITISSCQMQTNTTQEQITELYSEDRKAEIRANTFRLSDNAIDNGFRERFTNTSAQGGIRDLQFQYGDTWEVEYQKLLDSIEEKLIYEEDKLALENFRNSVDSVMSDIEVKVLDHTFVFTYMEQLYLDPPDDRHNSGGIGTPAYLRFQQGLLYRDICFLFIADMDYYKTPVID